MEKNKTIYMGSLLLGICTAGVTLFGLGLLNGWWLQSTFNDLSNLVFILMVLALVLAILLIAALIVTVANLKHHAPVKAHLYVWGPVLLTLLAFMIMSEIKASKKEAFGQSHPNIQELHINLSSKTLWITEPEENVLDKSSYEFVNTIRYAGSDRMLAYSGSRLSASFKDMSIYSSETESADHRVVLTLPVVQPQTYPDLSKIIRKVSESSAYYTPTEASLLIYLYYYYNDRVEVVPALNLSGSDSMALWGVDVPVVQVHLANLQPQRIARLEVDHQALALPTVWPEENNPNECRDRTFSGFIMSPLTAPIRVRWQFEEPNPQWHEAMVTTPQLPAQKSKPDWKARETEVFLYFQKDGSVSSQWQQVVTLKSGKLGIRTTEILPQLLAPAPCGAAEDNWADEVVRLKQ